MKDTPDRRRTMCRPPFLPSVNQTFGPGCCRPGLQAIERRCHNQLEAQDTRQILGSVDIDKRYKSQEPQSPRWDSVIGYHSSPIPRASFVEFHAASIDETDAKWKWLDEKLRNSNSPFLKSDQWVSSFHWVVGGKGEIPFTKLEVTRKLPAVQLEGRFLRLTG